MFNIIILTRSVVDTRIWEASTQSSLSTPFCQTPVCHSPHHFFLRAPRQWFSSHCPSSSPSSNWDLTQIQTAASAIIFADVWLLNDIIILNYRNFPLRYCKNGIQKRFLFDHSLHWIVFRRERKDEYSEDKLCSQNSKLVSEVYSKVKVQNRWFNEYTNNPLDLHLLAVPEKGQGKVRERSLKIIADLLCQRTYLTSEPKILPSTHFHQPLPISSDHLVSSLP